ncbi:MAG: DUF4384 domain-containing protein [candidate division WOR-3 bacterium]
MKKLLITIMVVIFFKGLHAKKVEVWTIKGNGSVYSAGEKISIKVLPHVSGYLYVYNIDSEGKVHVLFPKNRYARNNYVIAGKIYHLPYDFEEIEWCAGDEPGIEYVYAFITPYPLPYFDVNWFIPLSPDEYYYEDGILICYRFCPPYFFPRVYFYGWAHFYVIPRYYVYIYHPVPWYCYDCHHPHILFHFWFDFCPIYVIEFHDCCSYYFYPRYYKTYRYKYRIRPIYREIPPKKVREYRDIEEKYRNYDKEPFWASQNPLREKKEGFNEKKIIKEEILLEKPKEVKKNVEDDFEKENLPKKSKKIEKDFEKRENPAIKFENKENYEREYKREEKMKIDYPKIKSEFKMIEKNEKGSYNYRNSLRVKKR